MGGLGREHNMVFSTWGWGGESPSFTGQELFMPIIRIGNFSPVEPPAKFLFPRPKVHSPQPTKFNFSIENNFSE